LIFNNGITAIIEDSESREREKSHFNVAITIKGKAA